MKVDVMDYGSLEYELRIVGETKFEEEFLKNLRIIKVESTKMQNNSTIIKVSVKKVEV